MLVSREPERAHQAPLELILLLQGKKAAFLTEEADLAPFGFQVNECVIRTGGFLQFFNHFRCVAAEGYHQNTPGDLW